MRRGRGAGQVLQRQDEDQGHQEPAGKVAQGDAKIDAAFRVAVDLTQEPTVAPQGRRIDDDVQAAMSAAPRIRGRRESCKAASSSR